jgi:hypothetical protein
MSYVIYTSVRTCSSVHMWLCGNGCVRICTASFSWIESVNCMSERQSECSVYVRIVNWVWCFMYGVRCVCVCVCERVNPNHSYIFHTLIYLCCEVYMFRVFWSTQTNSARCTRSRTRQTDWQIDSPTEAKHRRRDNPNKTDNQHSTTLLARGHTQINKLNGRDKYTFTDAKKLHTIPELFPRVKLNHNRFVPVC